jgi:type VI protein secretion system component VasK
MEEQRDEKLWEIAKRRADFQNSLIGFVVITVLCWAIWYLTGGRHTGPRGTPWPLWVMLGLGIGLAFKFMKAYKTDKNTLAEQEYEKLKNRNK